MHILKARLENCCIGLVGRRTRFFIADVTSTACQVGHCALTSGMQLSSLLNDLSREKFNAMRSQPHPKVHQASNILENSQVSLKLRSSHSKECFGDMQAFVPYRLSLIFRVPLHTCQSTHLQLYAILSPVRERYKPEMANRASLLQSESSQQALHWQCWPDCIPHRHALFVTLLGAVLV